MARRSIDWLHAVGNNIGEIKQLTEIAHGKGITTDYRINKSPMTEQQHYDNNDTCIRAEDWPQVDGLIDGLIEKNKSGCRMANSIKRLNDMREFMKGKVEPWNCPAGQSSLILRVDTSLAPCFPMYSAARDWGRIEEHKFEVPQLNEMKKSCQTPLLLDGSLRGASPSIIFTSLQLKL